MTMKTTIITPTYNSEKTIERTIFSVISQPRNFDLEYIVIDGGSTDNTCDIIERYSDFIDIFISEPDNGAYDAMNKGITNASGDVIGIINSDDWYNYGAIQVVEEEFTTHPDIDIIYSSIDNYYNGEYVAKFLPGDLDKLPIRFTLNHPSCFIKKSAYELAGLYNTSYKIAADYDLILRLYLSNFKFHCINTSLAAYSLNGMSSSSNPWTRAKLIYESWLISQQTNTCLYNNYDEQRQAYIAWIINECFALPARFVLKPPNARKLKTFFNKFINKLVADN
jgi:glycosyltransferase involved in cell wall biosynthesis